MMSSVTDYGDMADHDDQRRPRHSAAQIGLARQLLDHENNEIPININDSIEEVMDASRYEKPT